MSDVGCQKDRWQRTDDSLDMRTHRPTAQRANGPTAKPANGYTGQPSGRLGADDRGQKADVGGRRSEGRCRMSDVRGQKAEDSGQLQYEDRRANRPNRQTG